MPKVSRERLRESIKIKLAKILNQEVSDPRLAGVTLTDLKLSPDQSHATVFFAVFGKEGEQIHEVGQALADSAGFLQKKLAHTLTSRNTPRLSFAYDRGFDNTSRIEDLLQDLKTKGEL